MKNERESAMYGTLIIVVSTLTDMKYKDKTAEHSVCGLMTDTDHDKTFGHHERNGVSDAMHDC